MIPGAENSERFYSVIGLFSPDGTPTTGRISAVGADGKEVGFYDFGLNTGERVRAFRPDLPDGSQGSLEPGLSRHDPADSGHDPRDGRRQGGRVGGYAVTVDLKTNDLTFIQGRPLS